MTLSPTLLAAVRALEGSKWAMDPMAFERYAARALSVPTCPSGRKVAKMRAAWLEKGNQAAAGAVKAAKGKVGIIGIHGPVQQRMTAELDKAGGTPLDYVGRAFDSLMAAPDVGSILLHIDSPGGEIYGTAELAQKVYDARGSKPIYAMVDSMCCSAAFWVGTAANQIICTPGGDVGSVGVYCMHVDESKSHEQQGVKLTLISAAKYKAELSSHKPLTDEARDYLQASVDETYGKFVAAVAKHRGISDGKVLSKFGQGRVVGADAALEAGMIDKIMTFDQLMAKLTGAAPSMGGSRGLAPDVLRMQHEWQKTRSANLTQGIAT